jgi:hypothetical protein
MIDIRHLRSLTKKMRRTTENVTASSRRHRSVSLIAMRLRLSLVAIVIAAASVSASAAAPLYVIQGDRSVGGLRLYRSDMADATAHFGKPSSTRIEHERSCVAAWPRIGLVVNFFTFEGPPCSKGGALTFTITSRSSWRTAIGLRVGDPVARVRALYPHAAIHSGYAVWNGYWLVTRHACAEVGGSAYPGLVARVHGRRVSALAVSGTVCD